MSTRWRRVAQQGFGLALIGVCIWVLQHELRQTDLDRVAVYIREISPYRVAAALGVTMLSHVALLGYDLLALRYVRRPMSWPRMLLAGYISNAFSNAISLPFLGIAAVRVYFYGQWGLSARKLAEMVVFIGLTAWLGLLAMIGLFGVLQPPTLPGGVPTWTVRTIAGLCLMAVGVYVALCVQHRRVQLWRWTLRVPRPTIGLGQIAVGSAEWLGLCMVFYVLLPGEQSVPLMWFLSTYLLVLLLAMIGAMPAGLAVLDAGVLVLLSPRVPKEVLVAALTLFRLVYHVPPLLLATLLLVGHELWKQLPHKGGAGESNTQSLKSGVGNPKPEIRNPTPKAKRDAK